MRLRILQLQALVQLLRRNPFGLHNEDMPHQRGRQSTAVSLQGFQPLHVGRLPFRGRLHRSRRNRLVRRKRLYFQKLLLQRNAQRTAHTNGFGRQAPRYGRGHYGHRFVKGVQAFRQRRNRIQRLQPPAWNGRLGPSGTEGIGNQARRGKRGY